MKVTYSEARKAAAIFGASNLRGKDDQTTCTDEKNRQIEVAWREPGDPRSRSVVFKWNAK